MDSEKQFLFLYFNCKFIYWLWAYRNKMRVRVTNLYRSMSMKVQLCNFYLRKWLWYLI